jgi:hypothetical protein
MESNLKTDKSCIAEACERNFSGTPNGKQTCNLIVVKIHQLEQLGNFINICHWKRNGIIDVCREKSLNNIRVRNPQKRRDFVVKYKAICLIVRRQKGIN